MDWFKSINKKYLRKFVNFNIKDFYPPIQESSLKQTLDFIKKYLKVSSEDKTIFKHARNSLLFNKQQTWIEKESRLFDGAEVLNLLEFLYFISSHANTTKTIWAYTETTAYQYLRI